MPIAPLDFLEVARSLLSGRSISDDEARYRTIAGRAYYSAYLETRQVGRRSLPSRPDFQPYHRSLAESLKTHPDAIAQFIGSRLDRMRTLRGRADYEPGEPVPESAARLMVHDAEYILSNVSSLSGQFPTGIAGWDLN